MLGAVSAAAGVVGAGVVGALLSICPIAVSERGVWYGLGVVPLPIVPPVRLSGGVKGVAGTVADVLSTTGVTGASGAGTLTAASGGVTSLRGALGAALVSAVLAGALFTSSTPQPSQYLLLSGLAVPHTWQLMVMVFSSGKVE